MGAIQKVERKAYVRGRLAVGLSAAGGILAPIGWFISAGTARLG